MNSAIKNNLSKCSVTYCSPVIIDDVYCFKYFCTSMKLICFSSIHDLYKI